MTEETPLQFRRARDGKWAVFGPCSQMSTGRRYVVTRDGRVTEANIERLSAAFMVDDVRCCYGYLARKGPQFKYLKGERRAKVQCHECDNWHPAGTRCTECGGC